MSYLRTVVLVTGPDGFLGTPLCEALVRAGATVRALTLEGPRATWLDRSWSSGEVERFVGDIRNSESVRAAAAGVDVVFHLAAISQVPWSLSDPRLAVEVNVNGTLNVLEAARSADAKVVLASSSQVYGKARYVPIDLDHPLEARNPYAATKIAQEALVQAWVRSYGLRATVLRTFFTYGPRQSLQNIVPHVIRQLLASERVEIGNLYPERDFVFVDDMVDAYVLAGLCEAADGQVLNLAGSELVSIRGLIDRVAAITGQSPVIVQDPSRMRPPGSEIDSVCGDSRSATEVMAWGPRVAIDPGLRATVAWFRQNLHHFEHGSTP